MIYQMESARLYMKVVTIPPDGACSTFIWRFEPIEPIEPKNINTILT